LAAAAVVVSGPAQAVDVALNAGALEVVLLPPAHGGFYPYLGVSLTVAPVERFSLTTSLSFEWCFEFGRGGLVLGVAGDYLVAEHVGIDLNVVLIHDQAGLDFATSELFLGVGPGVSFFLGRWIISPSVGLFGGLRTPGWSLVPALNVAFVL
jgi:hypothetical protein